ncbi:MAG: hypothetical protein M3440_11405, partial [Chloroflexota bacterium]|nr:hypothetical protein [Chloroflexota bacterium]
MASTQRQGKGRRSASKPADSASNGNVDASDAQNRDQGGTAAGTAVDTDKLVGLYQKMVEIRLFEDAALRGFRTGKIGGYLHVYSGQEAVALGFL